MRKTSLQKKKSDRFHTGLKSANSEGGENRFSEWLRETCKAPKSVRPKSGGGTLKREGKKENETLLIIDDQFSKKKGGGKRDALIKRGISTR